MNDWVSITRRGLMWAMAGAGAGASGDLSRAADLRAANLEVVERYCSAWRSGDIAALAECYHAEFTLHYPGNNPLSGVHAGKASALAVLAQVSRRTGRKLLEIEDCMAGPTRAAIIVRERFERDGQTAEVQRAFVYSIKDSKLHECWAYEFNQATVDRFLAE
jgi:ketosteroid isomerase-like protein